MFNSMAQCIIIVLAFIVLDFLSGILASVAKKCFTSSKMRQGLFNKFGIIVIIATCVLIDIGQKYIDLGFTVPILQIVSAYIILMEIGSIVENVSRINKNLIPKKVRDIMLKAEK